MSSLSPPAGREAQRLSSYMLLLGYKALQCSKWSSQDSSSKKGKKKINLHLHETLFGDEWITQANRMTAASYTFDDGHSCLTKCFPARTLRHRRKGGPGHWLVAYRRAEEQKYRNMRRRIKETYRERENDSGADSPRGNTLDGPFLLQLHCVDKPSELCSVDVSEQKLNSVKPEDLKVFDNVAVIDASINALSLDSFSSFVSLRELNLSLNGLCNMRFNAAEFPHLEVLDLSYNNLSADDIVSISQLPRLKTLHLTGNQLRHLPPNLGSLNNNTTQLPAKEEVTQFKALEVLMLDDNKLSSEVFNSLRNLKRLRFLNLQGNRISEIPYLQLTGGSQPLQTCFEEQAAEEGLASTEPDPNTDEHFKTISQIFNEDNWEERCKGSSLPLPELQFLNLADNKVAEEEALMAVALFPVLREIDIHSNPLTTRRSGDPPLLTYYLQERLGIKIKRKKTQEVAKFPLMVSTDPKWKVEDRVPKVSKKSLLMEAHVEKSEPTESEGKKSGDDTLQENTEHFFVTEVADGTECEFNLQDDEKETAENKEGNKEKFTCYEMLMEAKPNPDVVQPIGIQTAVRMLEHTLKNLNVYRDSKPKLDCIQTPYREREKKIKDLPPRKTMKQPAEIKECTTIRLPLSSALHSTGVDKQEALSLLRDMKTKYKTIHQKTMEQAAGTEPATETNQDGAKPTPVQRL